MKIEDCYVKFLPSIYGFGYLSTIRKDLGNSKKGWKQWYSHLNGTAQEFEPRTEWQAIVKFRLKQQVVTFK